MRGTGDNFRQGETSNVKKQLSPKTQIASGYWKSVTMSSCLVVPGAAFHCFTQLDTVFGVLPEHPSFCPTWGPNSAVKTLSLTPSLRRHVTFRILIFSYSNCCHVGRTAFTSDPLDFGPCGLSFSLSSVCVNKSSERNESLVCGSGAAALEHKHRSRIRPPSAAQPRHMPRPVCAHPRL